MDILKGKESYAPKNGKNISPKEFNLDKANRSLLFRLSTFSNENHIENAKVEIEEELTDEKFASIIGGKFSSVLPEKVINWESTGNKNLTQAQKDTLKVDYNIENISKQSFYNLFADLTNMNVISRDDIRRMYISNVVKNATLVSDDDYDAQNGFNSLVETERAVGELIAGLEHYKSPDFWKYNPNMNNHDFTIIVQKIEDRKESFTKFFRVLSMIKRDSVTLTNDEDKEFEYQSQYTNSLLETNAGFATLGPNAPEVVRIAWDKAEREVGVTGYGAESFGNLTYINCMVTLKVQDSISTQRNDFLGNTLVTAITATKKALVLHENLPSSNIQDPIAHRQERAFYNSFLRYLMQSQ